MSEEFDLSELMFNGGNYTGFSLEDVKEFIRLLKWDKKFEKEYKGIAKKLFQKHNEMIDRLAGDKLVNSEQDKT